jgi:Pyruvate/2-oxoacid:ferredoxin oxidoreductase delta subunit
MTVLGANVNWYNEHRPPFSDRAAFKDGWVVLVNDEDEKDTCSPVFFVSGGILKYWDMNEHKEEEMAMARESFGEQKAEEFRLMDHWKHRSSTMRCETCMWYLPKEIPAGSDHDRVVGRCRRHAPTMNGFPVVYKTDWCGDHKLDEEKI